MVYSDKCGIVWFFIGDPSIDALISYNWNESFHLNHNDTGGSDIKCSDLNQLSRNLICDREFLSFDCH